jgi:undecaprenyl-diphosphatase
MILAAQLLRLQDSDFLKNFEIIIQIGSILAVVFFYWKKLWNWEMIKKLFVAFLPTAVIGLALYKVVKTYLLGNTTVVLWALFLGGVILIVFELWHERRYPEILPDEKDFNARELSYKQATALGFFQAIAIVPGVSRSAATIVGGLWLGMKRRSIVEFSFLLAVPTMLAATGLDLFKSYKTISTDQFGLLAVGFIVSFLVALVAIKFLLNFIRRHNFIPFGVYRIVIALIIWLVIL